MVYEGIRLGIFCISLLRKECFLIYNNVILVFGFGSKINFIKFLAYVDIGICFGN
jgi:hypothetical protein